MRFAILLILSLVVPLDAHADSIDPMTPDGVMSATRATEQVPPITESVKPMKSLATHSPSNVCAADARDPNAGGASHVYVIGAGPDAQRIQFQHGARLAPESTPGAFDDDLLAIVQDRLSAFQAGPFACDENARALEAVRAARGHLGDRVAARMAQGVLGQSERHEPTLDLKARPLASAQDVDDAVLAAVTRAIRRSGLARA